MKRKLLRGVIGLALLVACALTLRDHYAISFVFLLLSFIPLRGCPACWTVDIVDAAKQKRLREP